MLNLPHPAQATPAQPAPAASTGPACDHTTLHRLLDQGLAAHAPTYRQGLANHLPMLLHALQQLGATPARMASFADAYAQRLEPRQPPAAATPEHGNWTALRGQAQAFEALRALFAAQLASQGAAATLTATLPQLMPGVAAAAFHGLIRTAHAAEAGHAGELAAGLAYWASSYLPLHDEQQPWPASTLPMPAWLAALQTTAAAAPRRAQRIVAGMQQAMAAPGAASMAMALQVEEGTLRALAEHAAALYAGSGDFTVLHAVTASRAMAVLTPYLPDDAARHQAQREFALALAAALLSTGLPRLDQAAAPPTAWPWPALKAAAMATNDDHSAKLVHACWQLGQRWPGADGHTTGLWAQAATRALRAAGAPPLAGLDHVHVQVRQRAQASAWYARVLGLQPVAALAHWAQDGGPLVLADAQGLVHLALFERGPDAQQAARGSTVAMAISPALWPAWRAHLAAQPGLVVHFQDHGQAWSLYFTDPDDNPYELTCYDVAALQALAP